MKHPDSKSGAWVFLSHSNKDFEQVREGRNWPELRRFWHFGDYEIEKE